MKRKKLAWEENEGAIAASIVLWTFLLVVLCTLVGLWVKFFWLEWILVDLLK